MELDAEGKTIWLTETSNPEKVDKQDHNRP